MVERVPLRWRRLPRRRARPGVKRIATLRRRAGACIEWIALLSRRWRLRLIRLSGGLLLLSLLWQRDRGARHANLSRLAAFGAERERHLRPGRAADHRRDLFLGNARDGASIDREQLVVFLHARLLRRPIGHDLRDPRRAIVVEAEHDTHADDLAAVLRLRDGRGQRQHQHAQD